MNDNEKTSAEDIRRMERERMAQVFASEVAQGKENTAKLLLTKTDLAADDILEILATVPTHRESAFEQAMAAIKNPDIRPAAEADNETPEAIAQRIASLI